MIHYAIVKPSVATAALEAQLSAHGAVAVPVDQAELLVAAVESIDDTKQLLASLGEAARSTLLLGSLPQVKITIDPAPDNLEGVLETYLPLGILRSDPATPWNPMAAGFTGSKALAAAVGAGTMKAFSTSTYGAWIRCDAMDSGDFVIRIARGAR